MGFHLENVVIGGTPAADGLEGKDACGFGHIGNIMYLELSGGLTGTFPLRSLSNSIASLCTSSCVSSE